MDAKLNQSWHNCWQMSETFSVPSVREGIDLHMMKLQVKGRKDDDLVLTLSLSLSLNNSLTTVTDC